MTKAKEIQGNYSNYLPDQMATIRVELFTEELCSFPHFEITTKP
jgi:hypothetical protein